MFTYHVTYDEKTVRQMIWRVIKFEGIRSVRPRIFLWILFGAYFLYLIADAIYDELHFLMVFNGDLSRVPLFVHLSEMMILAIGILGLKVVFSLKKRLVKTVLPDLKESVELTIDGDSISVDGHAFPIDDIICSEVYSRQGNVDLYLKLPPVKHAVEIRAKDLGRDPGTYLWARLTPQNLICGDHEALIFYLKKRLGDRIQVFGTLP